LGNARLKIEYGVAVLRVCSFQPVRWLTDDEYEVCSKKGQSTEAKNAITMSVAKSDTKPALAAPKAQAEEEVDEPEKTQAGS